MARLTAELRLSMAALRQDAERASAMLQQAFAKNFGGGGRQGLATDPTAVISQILSPGMQPAKGINMRMAALGMGAGIFSPWIGARLLNESGLMGAAGVKGLMGQLIGEGGMGGFGAAYVGLQVASRLLKGAFDDLRRSVREAAKLFFDAAKLRTTPGQLMSAKVALRAMGVPESQELLETLAYGRGRMGMGSMTKLAGISGQGDVARYMDSITSKDKRFWDEMAANSHDFHVMWTAFSYELRRISSILANEFLPSLNQWLVILNRTIQMFKKPEWLQQAEHIAGKMPTSALGVGRWLLSGTGIKGIFGDTKPGDMVSGLTWNRLHMSSFERMGFVMGRGTSPIDKVAFNTGRMVALLQAILGALGANLSVSRIANALPNLP